MSEFINSQTEVRNNLIMQVREVIDFAEAEGRGLDQAETNKITAIEADIAKAEGSIGVATRNEERKLETAAAAQGHTPSISEERSATDIFRNIAETRGSHSFEKRALTSSSNTVGTSFYDTVFDIARLNGPMLETSDVINTTTGDSLTIPTLSAYSTASIEGQGDAIAVSDPTFSSITLGAYKYAFLIQAAAELVNDASFDLAGHLAKQGGQALGYGINAGLTTGTGSGQPTGIVTGSALGGTSATSVAGAFSADDLIDLAYSVDGAVRRMPGVGFMANGASIGSMRKLKDTAGNYLYTIGQGYPDTFAGFTVVENPHLADQAVDAKSVLFGALDSYKARVAGGLQVASSSDYAFANDLVTWKFVMRVDGELAQASHVKHFVGAAS